MQDVAEQIYNESLVCPRKREAMTIQRKKSSSESMSMESGAAAVELSIALIVLFIFLVVFFQMTGLFLAHERISYSAYAGARANAVNGSVGNSVIATKSQNYLVGGDTVIVYENKRLPFNMSDIFRRDGQTFRLTAEASIPREVGTDGDN